MDESSDRLIVLAGTAAVAVVLAAAALALNRISYNIAVGIVVAVVIVVASVPVFRRLADADDDPRLLWSLLAALVAKLVFSVLRYWMVNRLYGGGGDSNRYADDGWLFAREVRAGDWFPAIDSIDSVVDSTRRVIKLTGYLFVITGRSLFAGFFVYSWLAFWGCLLCVRGAQRAFPEIDRRRYLYLVMFWPSLLFWPSSSGKDALMVCFLGVATYGACALLAPRARPWGLVPFAVGVIGMLLIRSHVALMAVLAVALAVTFAFIGGSRADAARGRGRAARLVGLVVVVVLASVAATQTTRFFSDEAGQTTSHSDALQLTRERTQKGGSSFEPVVVTSPLQLPVATVSVLFRPFPWEADNVGSLISAGEAALIGVLVVASWRRLRRWPGSAWRRQILIFGAVYSLMFIVAFSSIANAGILARQRSQMLPLFFLAFAVPATRWWRERPAEDADQLEREHPDPLGAR